MSLQKKISLLILAGLGGTLALFSWIGIHAAQESTDRTLQERLNNSRLVANSLDSLLLHAVQDLRELSLDIDVDPAQETTPRVARMQQDFLEMGLNIHDVFLLDNEGRTGWESSPGLMHWAGPLPAINEAFAKNDYYISDSFSNSPTGKTPMVVLAVRRPANEAQKPIVVGFLVDAIQLGSERLLGPVPIGDNGYAEIVDGQGTVIGRTSPGLPPKADEVSDHPGKFSDLIRQDKAIVSTCHRCHGDETSPPRRRDVIAFAPLSMTSWGVALRQPEEEVLAPVYNLEKQLIFFAVLLAIAGLIMVWSLTKSVVKPIKALILASTRIAGGDLQGAVPATGNDEIGQLSRSFDAMRIKLRSTQDEIKEWNRNLEERVRQRTAELSYQLEIARILGSTVELKSLLQRIMSRMTGFIRPVQGTAYLLLYDAGKNALLTRATAGEAIAYDALEAPFQKIAEEAYTSGLVQYNQSLNPAPAMTDLSDKKLASCLGVPIVVANSPIGVLLVIGRKNLTMVGPPEIRLIEATAQQLGLALENAQLHSKVEEMAILQERDRIAREIHDGLAQTLAFLNLQIGAIRDEMKTGETEKVKAELEKMAKATGDAYDEVREIIVGLDSEARLARRVSDLGLVSVLNQLVSQFEEQSGIPAELSLGKDSWDQMPLRVQVQLLRVVQEALTNIRKHALATAARVQLEEQDGRLELQIIDNGRGFVPGSFSPEKHLGMGIMKRRVESLNGTLSVKSAPAAGTRIVVSLPVSYVKVANT